MQIESPAIHTAFRTTTSDPWAQNQEKAMNTTGCGPNTKGGGHISPILPIFPADLFA